MSVFKNRDFISQLLLLSGLFYFSLLSVCAFGQSTWTNGNATGIWNDGANWAPAGVPAGVDVIFDVTSTAACAIDVSINVTSISINAGYTGIITQNVGQTITVGAGGFSQVVGTFNGGDADITVGGNFTIAGGGTFASTSANVSITGNFSNAGTFIATPANLSITENFANTGTFNANGGTVTFADGLGNANISGVTTFVNIEINKAPGTENLNSIVSGTKITAATTKLSSGRLRLTDINATSDFGTVTGASGTRLEINGGNLGVAWDGLGDFTGYMGTAGTFISYVGGTNYDIPVQVDGQDYQNLNVENGGAKTTLGNITVNATTTTSGTVVLDLATNNNSLSTNDLDIQAGSTLNAGDAAITVLNSTDVAGTLDMNTGTGTFISINMTLASGGIFNGGDGNVTVATLLTVDAGGDFNGGAGGMATLALNNVTVNGTGTFQAGPNNTDVSGSFTIATPGNFTANNGDFRYIGAGAQVIQPLIYNNLITVGAAKTTTAGGTIDVQGTYNGVADLTLTNTLEFGGAVTLGGTHDFTGGTVDYDQAAAGQQVIGGAAVPYNNLIVTGGNKTTDGFSTIDVDGDFGGAANFTLNGATIEFGGNISYTGTGDYSSGTTVYNSSAVLQNVLGSVYNNLTITGTGTKTLLGNTTVNGLLTLVNGVLHAGIYTLTVNASNPIVDGVGGSDLSDFSTSNHIDGKVQTTILVGNTYNFPVGDNGDYRPVILQNQGSTASNYCVQHISAIVPIGIGVINPNMLDLIGDPSNTAGTIESVLYTRYWEISGTNQTTDVTLQVPSSDDVNSTDDLRIVRLITNDWEEIEQPNNTSPNDLVSPFNVLGQTTSFGTFSLVSTDAMENPLYVTSIGFTRQTPVETVTNADQLTFRVTFNKAVMGVGANDFIPTGTTGTITNVNPITGSIYDVTVSGGDLAGLNGIVGLDFSGGMNIMDIAGNSLPNIEPATDETYTLENSIPSEVPTMSQWGILILSLLILIIGIGGIIEVDQDLYRSKD